MIIGNRDGLKLAVCQMQVIDNKSVNIKKALTMIEIAASNRADLVVLPEMFNCPYDNDKFREYSENMKDSQTLIEMSKAAINFDIYLIAGSIPESENGKLYNSSFTFNKDGEIIGRHRKIHLLDIEMPGRIEFKESDTLSPGNQITVFNSEFCKIGVAICYDIRFPELSRIMTLKGAKIIIVPGAFNMITGPAHWEPLIRVRAVDNQVYFVAASPARDENSSYVAYGNSMIVNPWGEIVSRAVEKEEIIYAEISFKYLEKIRRELPLLKQRRTDIYDLLEKNNKLKNFKKY
jgi:omega-amidase